MSALRTRAVPQREQKHKEKSREELDEEENQVIPFELDDGTDDNEEIRRRRYSSSGSSSSEDSRDMRSRKRGGYNAKARRAHQKNLDESEWEKASSGRDSISERASDSSDSEGDGRHVPSKKRQEEEPESPRRTGRTRKTQQSSESDSESEVAERPRKESATSVATATSARISTSSAPSTPRAVPVDLAGLSKLAVFPGSENGLLKAYVRRAKTLLHSQYHFYINEQLILMAEKQPKSRTPNYHLFDMTRAVSGLSSKLTKKSGNYIGKLRSNFTKKKSVLIGNQSHKTELAAVIFSGNVSSSEPRRLTVVLPPLNTKRQEVDGIAVGDEPGVFSVLVEHYKAVKKQKKDGQPVGTRHQHVQIYENKQPVFENGFYRLNFHGRVSVPSVKNFQLIRDDDAAAAAAAPPVAMKSAPPQPPQPRDREEGPPVYLQFGKVDENKFHLDFRAPITPIQAFAIALAQFNL